jgi:hypothetical protein
MIAKLNVIRVLIERLVWEGILYDLHAAGAPAAAGD